jgi:hypothetical protein
MAEAPTAADTAAKIIKFFAEHKARPGHVLIGPNWTQFQIKHNVTAEELRAGLTYAGEKDWIDNGPQSDSVKLTEAGFKATP